MKSHRVKKGESDTRTNRRPREGRSTWMSSRPPPSLPLLLLVGNTRMRIIIVEAHKGAVNFINIGVLQHHGSCSPCYGLSIRRPTLGQRLSAEGERDIPQTSIRQPSPSSPPPPPLTSTSSFNKSITRSSLGSVSQNLFNIPLLIR